MAGRSFWSGYLKLTLVTCPVQMTPAVTQAERVRFHTLNAATGNRVVSRYVDGVSGKAVADNDQIRGYPVGEEAFSVIREAMVATKTVGLSKLVLYRRERPIMIEPRGLGMVVWTLRQVDEVRDEDAYFRGIKPAAPPKEAMTLALSVIKERQTDWSEELLGDRVQASLKKIIARKKKGQKVVASKPAPAETGKVIDLMAALRKSLEADKKKR